jgi:hypothetical protein
MGFLKSFAGTLFCECGQSMALELRFPSSGLPLVLDEESPVLDLVFVIATVVFFAAAWAYVRACGQP